MGWGRGSSRGRDRDDGWNTVQYRGRGNRWGRGGGGNGGGDNRDNGDGRLKSENEELKKKLKEAERACTVASDRTFRPNARDSSGRHGDWMCLHCMFRSNRAARSFCYRCTAPKGESHGSGSGAVVVAGLPQVAASQTAPSASTSSQPAPIVATSSSSPTLPSSPSSPSPSASTGTGAEAAKAIRQRITALEGARGLLANCEGCEADRARLEQDLAVARQSLASHLPVEQAVRCTLATPTQARATAVKAEGKVARLEAQLTNVVEQYEHAMAELASSRAKLAEAEAATAKAASVALPPEHYLAAVASDPGPFWSAFKSVIVQRCPGLPTDFLGQLDNVTKAFEAVIEPIFHPVGKSPEGSKAPEGAAPPVAPAAPAGASQLQADSSVQQAGAPAPQPPPPAPLGGPPATAEDAMAMAWQQPQCQRANSQPTPPGAAAAQAQPQLAAGTIPSASAVDTARAILAVTAAAAAAPVSDARHDGGVDADGDGLNGGGNRDSSSPEPGNDPMGGGAANGIANKRGISEIADTARAIVAKAKAKPPSS